MGVSDKLRAVRSAIGMLEKQFGKGAVMTLAEGEAREPVAVIPTGSLAIDAAVGVGGYPRGRIVEVFGPESSGKTTLALHAIAEVQRAGGVAAFVDAEHALDVGYAQALGVDLSQLLISQPDHGEQALEIADALVRSGAVELVVIDSVAALVPKAELDGDMGDQHMALQARLMSQALRKLTAVAHRNNACVMFIKKADSAFSPRNHQIVPRASSTNLPAVTDSATDSATRGALLPTLLYVRLPRRPTAPRPPSRVVRRPKPLRLACIEPSDAPCGLARKRHCDGP